MDFGLILGLRLIETIVGGGRHASQFYLDVDRFKQLSHPVLLGDRL